jgi:hypothetical protein
MTPSATARHSGSKPPSSAAPDSAGAKRMARGESASLSAWPRTNAAAGATDAPSAIEGSVMQASQPPMPPSSAER